MTDSPKPVAWTQQRELDRIAEGIERRTDAMWAVCDKPDDVALYSQADFLAMKERAEKAEAVLLEIADSDPIDNMLDPDRNRRLAIAALKGDPHD